MDTFITVAPNNYLGNDEADFKKSFGNGIVLYVSIPKI